MWYAPCTLLLCIFVGYSVYLIVTKNGDIVTGIVIKRVSNDHFIYRKILGLKKFGLSDNIQETGIGNLGEAFPPPIYLDAESIREAISHKSDVQSDRRDRWIVALRTEQF